MPGKMGGGESRGVLQGRNRQAIDGSGQTAGRKHETGNQRRYAPVHHKEADRSLPQFPLEEMEKGNVR